MGPVSLAAAPFAPTSATSAGQGSSSDSKKPKEAKKGKEGKQKKAPKAGLPNGDTAGEVPHLKLCSVQFQTPACRIHFHGDDRSHSAVSVSVNIARGAMGFTSISLQQ
jgi:hypothetical protein